MPKTKVISQKRFVKGVDAGTGILTQPPSTIIRVSNLFFNQRGSLTTTNGSGIIGVLNTASAYARALGVFTNLLPGQYPYYPSLTAPQDFFLPDVTGFTGIPIAGTDNPPGTYVFAVCAVNGSEHSNPVAAEFTFTVVLRHWDSVTFTWDSTPNATGYQLFYIPSGAGSTEGVLLGSPSTASFAFSGVLPTTPLVTLPFGNNSYQLSVQIGNIAPPSKQVNFTSTADSLPSFPIEPAVVSPGDPNFQFQTSITSTGMVTGVGTATATATQTGSGTTTVPGTPTTAFINLALTGVSVSFSLTVDGSLSASGASWATTAEFQYTTDGGGTWTTAFTWAVNSSHPPSPLLNPTLITGSATGLTNLADLQFRVLCIAFSSVGGNATVTGNILDFSASYSSIATFTPYGGVEGFVDWVPQILQFNQVSIFILGNGYAPSYLDPSQLAAATLTALTNTFQSTFPAWQATVAWAAGDQISVNISGTNYVFTALQGGVSASTPPAWPTTISSTVSDGQVVWQNNGPLTTSVAPRGAAHGIVYAGSLWLYNTSPTTTADQIDGPTCLKMSDSNTQNSWNPVNTAFLGKDDGTQGTGMATFTVAEVGIAPTQSLVCFKEFSTYQIIGVFGATDFQITQAQTDLGCIASRSIQFLTGYGIIRLSHMGFAIFDGVKDRLISEEIRPYLFGGIQLNADLAGIDFTYAYISQGTQTASPPMYLCACPLLTAAGVMTRLFVYDLVLKAWTILDLPWPITVFNQMRTGEGQPLLVGFRGDGTGILERFFAGDLAWDAASLVSSLPATSIPIQWTFSTVYIYGEGSTKRIFYRSVTLRGQSTSTVALAITVSVKIDGNPPMSFQTYVYPQPFSGQFEAEVDLMFTGQIVNLTASGTGVVTIDGIDWQISEKPGGRLMIG